MSDLRTELFTKVLPKMQTLTKHTELDNLSFDDPEQPEITFTTPAESLTKITNNELLFNWIKEHPACNARAVSDAFADSIDHNSVFSQLHGLAARKLLHKTMCSTTGKLIYSAAVEAYPRTSRIPQIERMNAARAAIGDDEISRRIREGHKAKRLEEAEVALEPVKKKIVMIKRRTPEPVAAPTIQVTPVDLNTLSIVQARKLYDELKQIFGA